MKKEGLGENEYLFENRQRICWNNGFADQFIIFKEDGTIDYLPYDEFHYRKVHQLCGGKHYFHSDLRETGSGYITHIPENMICVGFYRTDTPKNESQHPVEIKAGINVMVPWEPHNRDQKSVLKKYPTIITFGYGVGHQNIVYCDFYESFRHVLEKLLNGENIIGRCLVREMINPTTYLPEKVVIGFADYFGWSERYNPWEFVNGETASKFKIAGPSTSEQKINHTAILNDGTPVGVGKMNKTYFAKKYLFDEYDDFENFNSMDESNKEFEKEI